MPRARIAERRFFPARATLPDPFYYLKNFQTVLYSIESRYAELLSQEERQFMAHFAALPQPSQALLVRMVTRQGVFFRRSRLSYPEIGETLAAVEPLLRSSLVDAMPMMNMQRLTQLFTKQELLQNFAFPRSYRTLKKSDLLAALAAQYPGSNTLQGWCPNCGDCIYELKAAPLCERFRWMFFGNSHQDWGEFVLADLGIFSYEAVPESLKSAPFRTRAHIDSFEHLYTCRQLLAAGSPADEVLARIPTSIVDCDWLEDRRQKLLFYVARAFEKSCDPAAALRVLSGCSYRGARMRSVRLRERAHEWEAARDLCLAAQLNPENESERQLAARLLPRLNRKLGIAGSKAPATSPVPTFEMSMDSPIDNAAVEYRVRDCLATEDGPASTIHYVENGLVNSLFGLLCWRAIFAPIPGAFFHGFQSGPADLSTGNFFARRQSLFAECFAELESNMYKRTIRQCLAAKAGVQNYFVAWGLLSRRLLDWALTCIPAEHLKLMFEWIASDVHDNRAGFPDLVQFWPQQRRYRMIEVKGPGDRLQDNQRRLLDFCVAHGIPVSVCFVRWKPIK
jgi:VRR-NUC domain/Fanconi anemia-associated nuclease SAP domain